ncbi:MAG TPA: SMC-Scp complex subunit ScpB [Planctomycetes bacterium]|nr:SMC-Scp complex subunit ScpB [Planctomycetota bacterium]
MTDNEPQEKVDAESLGSEPDEQTEQSPNAQAGGDDFAPRQVTQDDESDESGEITVESVAEAVLFASDEPISAERLAGIVEAGGVREIRRHIETLNTKYEAGNFAFRIEQIAGGYQMMTLSRYNHWLKKLLRARTDTKLSQAALETLAIIAYKQPIMRADIEAIRGVAAGEMIRGLMYKGLVKIVGRAEVLGRPMLYGTTKKFLEVFGLNTIKDLPKVEELKKPE